MDLVFAKKHHHRDLDVTARDPHIFFTSPNPPTPRTSTPPVDFRSTAMSMCGSELSARCAGDMSLMISFRSSEISFRSCCCSSVNLEISSCAFVCCPASSSAIYACSSSLLPCSILQISPCISSTSTASSASVFSNPFVAEQ